MLINLGFHERILHAIIFIFLWLQKTGATTSQSGDKKRIKYGRNPKLDITK